MTLIIQTMKKEYIWICATELVRFATSPKANFPPKNLRNFSLYFYKNKFLIFFFPFLFISLFLYCVFARALPALSKSRFEIYQWHALGREEQAKYYELARRERQLHMQMYPDWSSRTNATRGKKRKRKQEPNDGGTNTHNIHINYFFTFSLFEIWCENLKKLIKNKSKAQWCEDLRATIIRVLLVVFIILALLLPPQKLLSFTLTHSLSLFSLLPLFLTCLLLKSF